MRTYVAVDGGMSDNPRPVLYGSGYEAFLPRATDAPRELAASVVGKHCESGDTLVRDAIVPSDIAVGDILATPVTGAYGHSMGSNYNKVPRPAVVFVAGGAARPVVRRETYDDLLACELDSGRLGPRFQALVRSIGPPRSCEPLPPPQRDGSAAVGCPVVLIRPCGRGCARA